MYKVLHVGQSLGGVDTYIRLIIKHISIECDSYIVHGEGEAGEFEKIDGTLAQSYRLDLTRNISLIKDTIALIKLIRLVKKVNPDLIHCHSSKGGLIG